MVSVIIPHYNHRAELFAAIQSILDQTYQNFEIIVINNDTSIILDLCEIDNRIMSLSITPSGKDGAVNLGILMAHGDYIAFQDADDVSLPYRLEVCMANIEDNDLIYGDKITVFQNQRKKYEQAKMFTRDTLHNGSLGVFSSIMVKTDVAKRVQFNPIGYDSDREWCARLYNEGITTKYINLPMYYYYNYTSNFRIRQRGFPFRYFDAVRNRVRLIKLRSKADKIVRRVLDQTN